MKIFIYVEGHYLLRKAFKRFIDNYFNRNVNVRIFTSKGKPVKEFCKGIKYNPQTFSILLMDSDVLEKPYIESVKSRKDWNLCTDLPVENDQLHFMVQCMESWFFADKEKLNAFYGNEFNQNKLSKRKNTEEIPKQDIFNQLKAAAKNTQKGEYHKTKHAPRILFLIDPRKVCGKSEYCKRFFDILEAVTGQGSY